MEKTIQVDITEDQSILQVAHDNNIDLEGACEGSLACSTCHVILEPTGYALFEAATDEENDMLDLAFGLTPTSRLGCQLLLNRKELDGLVIWIPSATRNISNESLGQSKVSK